MLQPEIVVYSDAEVTPFWRRIPKFFLYPLHLEPLLYSALLAAASLLAAVLPAFVVEFGIMLATLRYAFRVMEQTSLGHLTPGQHDLEPKSERVNLPYKLIGILLFWGFIVGLIAGVNRALGFVANLFLTLALPASVMALSIGNSFIRGLNPVEWIGVMRAVGKRYFVLWAFLFLLLDGAPAVLKLLAPMLGGWFALPVVNFAFIYFTLVMFNMMGYCLYQYHHMLGLKVKVDFDRAHEVGAPVAKPRDTTGEEIAAKVAAGDIKGAIEAAYEQQRLAPNDVAVQERYHKLLLMGDKPDRVLSHGAELISLLLRNGRGEQAFKVFKDCRQLREEFAPAEPGEIPKLAQAGRRIGEYKLALAMARDFEKSHPRHRDVPAACLLSAQILSENFKKDEMASLILNGMMQKFPDHPLAAEAGAYLKVLERMAALRAAPKH